MAPRIHLHVLASGSKGNASLVEGPEGLVLVDDGLSRRELLGRARQLGLDANLVSCVVVTHEHADHVSGLSVFCNHYTGRLVATRGTASARPYLASLPFETVGQDDEFEAAGMRVRTFPTSHDVAEPFGLRFDCGEGGDADSLGLCTDTGVLGKRALELLTNVRILALESNHDSEMLAEGPYPDHLKRRVGGDLGHLSNDQASKAALKLVGPATESIVAMHLSQKNNRPELAVEAIARTVGAAIVDAPGLVARTPDGRLSVRAASQSRPMSVS